MAEFQLTVSAGVKTERAQWLWRRAVRDAGLVPHDYADAIDCVRDGRQVVVLTGFVDPTPVTPGVDDGTAAI